MTTRPSPQCLTCRHWVSPLQRDDEDAKSAEPTQICDAFRTGIPDEIWANRADHREPYEGDQGIQFEANPGMTFPDWALADGRG